VEPAAIQTLGSAYGQVIIMPAAYYQAENSIAEAKARVFRYWFAPPKDGMGVIAANRASVRCMSTTCLPAGEGRGATKCFFCCSRIWLAVVE